MPPDDGRVRSVRKDHDHALWMEEYCPQARSPEVTVDIHRVQLLSGPLDARPEGEKWSCSEGSPDELCPNVTTTRVEVGRRDSQRQSPASRLLPQARFISGVRGPTGW